MDVVLYPVALSVAWLNRGSLYGSLMVRILSFVAHSPAIPAVRGMRISLAPLATCRTSWLEGLSSRKIEARSHSSSLHVSAITRSCASPTELTEMSDSELSLAALLSATISTHS